MPLSGNGMFVIMTMDRKKPGREKENEKPVGNSLFCTNSGSTGRMVSFDDTAEHLVRG